MPTNEPSWLRAVVRNTHTLIKERPDDLDHGYLRHRELLQSALPEFLRVRYGIATPPAFFLHVEYAFEKRSMVVFNSGQVAIIHNRFYGQTLSNLNKLFSFADSAFPSFCYMFRLVEEEFYVQRF